MNIKKIVIIARNIYPFQSPRSFRATELAKELGRQGHDVTLYGVLGSYDYTDFQNKYNVKIRSVGKVRFLPVKSDGNSAETKKFIKILATPIKKMIEFPFIELMFKIPDLLGNEKDVDLLITVAIPHTLHWGAALAKAKKPRHFPQKWIADCGDPFMGNKFEKPFFYFKFLEKWAFRKADYITIPVEEAREAYYKEFHSKIKIIPQGFNFEEINFKNEDTKNSVPRFAYAGFFYKGIRDPTIFLQYLSSIPQDFKFIIYTRSKDLISPFLNVLGDRIEMRDYIPRLELLAELSKMDFLVNFENGTEAQSPSKLIDYALVKKPILSVNSYSLNERNIENFLKKDYSGQLIVKDIEQYDIKNVAAKFLEL